MRAATANPVILTRTGAVNQRLGTEFEQLGARVLLWPAFKIRLPADEQPVAERLSSLDDVELVLLVSPSAVAAVSHWVDRWPSHITLAAVGEGTARIARKAWGEDVPIVYPHGSASQSGSEALMAELRHRGIPSRVLICRGQTGREWLSQQLIAEGADVQTLTCYERTPLAFTDSERQQIGQLALSLPPPVIYITSSETVSTLMHALHPVEGAWKWLVSGGAVVIHPRSEAVVREAGFRFVRMSDPRDEEVIRSVFEVMNRLSG